MVSKLRFLMPCRAAKKKKRVRSVFGVEDIGDLGRKQEWRIPKVMNLGD